MKRLVVFLIIAAFLFSSVPAFAVTGSPPGDGGFFTKFFNGLLGDSWTRTPSKKTHTGTKEKGEQQRKKIIYPQL